MQPGRWEISPTFDKDGRPVEYLKRVQDQPDEVLAQERSFFRRGELAAAIKGAGLARPPNSKGLIKNVRKTRGAKAKKQPPARKPRKKGSRNRAWIR